MSCENLLNAVNCGAVLSSGGHIVTVESLEWDSETAGWGGPRLNF
jgi:hypothetical protein